MSISVSISMSMSMSTQGWGAHLGFYIGIESIFILQSSGDSGSRCLAGI